LVYTDLTDGKGENQMTNYAQIETVILSRKFDEHIQAFQSLISERNEDIADLCEQLKQRK
jgi:hypothetical protein